LGGALVPSESGKRWGILYDRNASPQRRRFTIGHEFGQYLLHRKKFPDGIRCDEAAVDGRVNVEVEREANAFSAALLMPLDDFRKRIAATDVPNFDDLGACADRYDVSLTAVILRWLRYTDRIDHPPGVWFGEPVREMSFHSTSQNCRFTLLHLKNADHGAWHSEQRTEDTYDRFMRG
jgi:hypothetical protein